MKVYAFDVDETLEVSGGPIKMQDLWDLHSEGHVVGLCGNWARVTMFEAERSTFWRKYINFLGPMKMSKPEFLLQLKDFIPADEYIMVGNIKGVTGASDDKGAAEIARWRFISEREFSEGIR